MHPVLKSAALALALAACSSVTDRGKTAPACKGELSDLNPGEDARWPNTFNDLHRNVRPGVRS